jgi:hypothetical protein
MEYFQRQIVGWLAILMGAFFLAKSVARRREKGHMRELLGLPTDKVKRFRNFLMQRFERVAGFLFMLFGIGLHLYVVVRESQKEAGGNDPREALGEITTYLAIASVCMLAITAVIHWFCSWSARRHFLEIMGYYVVRLGYKIGDDAQLMMQVGEMLGLARTEDDTVESYARRIEQSLRLDEIRARLLAKGKLPDPDRDEQEDAP